MKTNISLILLGLGLVSASAYAGTVADMPMPVSNDINVTAPDQSGMWSFGGTAVFMQASNKTFDYADTATFSTNPPPNTVIDFNRNTVDEDYHWWFGADITYAFPGHGRDVMLAYEGLHGDSTDHTRPDPASTAAVSAFSGFQYTEAKGKSETDYDAGDLVFGQKLDVGERIRLHPFIGVRYAHIDLKDTGTYAGPNTPSFSFIGATGDSVSEASKIENTFNGVGPRLGSDAEINLGQGFSIRGRLGLSALIGSHTVDNSGVISEYDANGVFIDNVLSASNDSDSETRVIPEVDGRLGLNYTYNFDSNMAMGFEAGWQATNYFNVASDQRSVSGALLGALFEPLGPLGAASGDTHYGSTSNFAIQGPYARLQLDIA